MVAPPSASGAGASGRPRIRVSRILRWWALALAVAMLTAACAGEDGESTPTTQPEAAPVSVVVARADEPSGFNVHHPDQRSPVAFDVATTVWPSAYRIHPDFTLEPWLLSAPATIASTEPFTVEWRIRPDAEWSDGVPVTAADFDYLYRHCAGLVDGTECVDRALYQRISRFEAVDDKTVRLTFGEPFVEFEALFRHLVPSHTVAAGAAGWNEGFVADPGPSAGPLVFDEWRRGEGVALAANPAYFGTVPEVERLVVRFLEPDLQLDGLRTGEVDVAFPEPSLELLGEVEGMAAVRTQQVAGAKVEVLAFNLDHPLLATPAARRAVALGIGRREIVESLITPVNPDARRLDNRVYVVNQPQYEGHGGEFRRRDVELATAELTAAGFTRDAEGFFQREGERIELRLATTTGDARREDVVQLVQAHLQELGLSVTIDNRPEAEFEEALAAGEFDLAHFGRRADPFPVAATTAAYGTGGADNVSGLSQERVDELIATAGEESDDRARAQTLNQLDQALWEFLPDLPLYQPPLVVAAQRTLRGVTANPTTQGHLWNVEEWRVVEPES